MQISLDPLLDPDRAESDPTPGGDFERRLRLAIGRHGVAVQRLDVSVSFHRDVPGADPVSCRMRARLRDGEQILVAQSGDGVAEVARFAAELLARRLDRRRFLGLRHEAQRHRSARSTRGDR